MKKWSEKEIKMLIDLFNMWSPLRNIATMLKRSKNSVLGKLHRLRRHQLYAAKLIRPINLSKSHKVAKSRRFS